MGVDQTIWKVQGRSHISVATIAQVGLEEEALHLAAFGLLLGLDVMERELEGGGRRQPGLE